MATLGTAPRALGLLSPLLVSAGAGAAALGSTDEAGYSFLLQTVSDLGRHTHSNASWWFNAGLVCGGVCMAGFIASIAQAVGSWRIWMVAAVGIVAALAMSGVGLFPGLEPTRTLHFATAGTAFFAMALLSAGFLWLLWAERPPMFPLWLAWPGVVSLVSAASFVALVLAMRLGWVARSALVWHDPSGTPILKVVPALEWVVMVSMLLWCGLTAWGVRRVRA